MKVGAITTIIDTYSGYKKKINQLQQDLHIYRLSNALIDGEDENTLAIQLEIAETESEMGQYLDTEV